MSQVIPRVVSSEIARHFIPGYQGFYINWHAPVLGSSDNYCFSHNSVAIRVFQINEAEKNGVLIAQAELKRENVTLDCKQSVIDLQETNGKIYCNNDRHGGTYIYNTGTKEFQHVMQSGVTFEKDETWTGSYRIRLVYEPSTKRSLAWTSVAEVGTGFVNIDLDTGVCSLIEGFDYQRFPKTQHFMPYFFVDQGIIHFSTEEGDKCYQYHVATNKMEELPPLRLLNGCGLPVKKMSPYGVITPIGEGKTITLNAETNVFAVITDWRKRIIMPFPADGDYRQFLNNNCWTNSWSNPERIKTILYYQKYNEIQYKLDLSTVVSYMISIIDPAPIICDKIESRYSESMQKLVPKHVLNNESILSHMKKLLNDEESSNLVFQFADGEKLYAHTAILQMENCELIESMIDAAGESDDKIVIPIDNLQILGATYYNLYALLKFIYTRELHTTTLSIPEDASLDNLFLFYNMTRMFGIQSAVISAYFSIFSRMNEDTIWICLEKASEIYCELLGYTALLKYKYLESQMNEEQKQKLFESKSACKTAIASEAIELNCHLTTPKASELPFITSNHVSLIRTEQNLSTIERAQQLPRKAVSRLLNNKDWVFFNNCSANLSDDTSFHFGNIEYGPNSARYPQPVKFDTGFSITFTTSCRGNVNLVLSNLPLAISVSPAPLLGVISSSDADSLRSTLFNYHFCSENPERHETRRVQLSVLPVNTGSQEETLITVISEHFAPQVYQFNSSAFLAAIQEGDYYFGFEDIENADIKDVTLTLYDSSDEESIQEMRKLSEAVRHLVIPCGARHGCFCKKPFSIANNEVTCGRHTGPFSKYEDVDHMGEFFTNTRYHCCGATGGMDLGPCPTHTTHLMRCLAMNEKWQVV